MTESELRAFNTVVIKANVAAAQLAVIQSQVKVLVAAVEAADLYIESYDTSAPSRIKVTTKLAIADALELIRPEA